MAKQTKDSHEITLRLDDINQMFVEPEFNLDSQRTIFSSGLEHVVSRMRSNWMFIRGVTICLPAEGTTPGLEGKTGDTIRRYSQFKIEELHQEIISIRWQAFKALQTGAVFLTVCLFLSIFFREIAGLPDFLSRVLGEGFLIAGWVGIWKPTELFLYEWWPTWRDIQVYQNLQKLTITIKGY